MRQFELPFCASFLCMLLLGWLSSKLRQLQLMRKMASLEVGGGERGLWFWAAGGVAEWRACSILRSWIVWWHHCNFLGIISGRFPRGSHWVLLDQVRDGESHDILALRSSRRSPAGRGKPDAVCPGGCIVARRWCHLRWSGRRRSVRRR